MKNSFNRLLSACFMILFMLVSVAVSAQDASNSNGGIDPVKIYVDKNPDAPLSRLLISHPEDGNIVKAIQTAYMLENLKEFPELSQQKIDGLKKDNDFINQNMKELVKLVEQGNSFERAKIHIMKNQENEKTRLNSPAPSFMAAPSK